MTTKADRVYDVHRVMSIDHVILLIHDDAYHCERFVSQKNHAPYFTSIRRYVVEAFHAPNPLSSTDTSTSLAEPRRRASALVEFRSVRPLRLDRCQCCAHVVSHRVSEKGGYGRNVKDVGPKLQQYPECFGSCCCHERMCTTTNFSFCKPHMPCTFALFKATWLQ